jgi:hypothetical protein
MEMWEEHWSLQLILVLSKKKIRTAFGAFVKFPFLKSFEMQFMYMEENHIITLLLMI